MIKGMALNHHIYGENQVRTFGDLDILVDHINALRLNQVLNENGFYQKIGPTSATSLSGRNARAFLALHAGTAGKQCGSLPYPVKNHQDKPAYKPYQKEGHVNIEVHDGLYFFPQSYIETMLDQACWISEESTRYLSLDLEHTFLLLLTNVYQNSESFFSNTYDFDMMLRDYVDLRFFIKKHKNHLDWLKVEHILSALDIGDIVNIVIGNLLEIYDKGVTYGLLPFITPKQSLWNANILDRMQNTDLARQSALTVKRDEWRKKSRLVKIYTYKEDKMDNLDDFGRCPSCPKILYKMEYSKEKILLYWAIPSHVDDSSLLFQFAFFPLVDIAPYTSYKVHLSRYNGEYKAYGHRYNLGAIRKETKDDFAVLFTKRENVLIVQIKVPIALMGIDEALNGEKMCVTAEVYKKHYRDIYHRYRTDGGREEMLRIKGV